MHRFPTDTSRFQPLSGVLINPYMGFTTFQHFRGDPLYSDRMPGWAKEFYPPRADAVYGGEAEGFFPDTRIAYIRIDWRAWEPQDGVFDCAFLSGILERAAKRGQSVLLRLMPHTTRWEQDIPDWLAAQIPHPARPVEGRVKESPDDPRFFHRFAQAIRALGAHIDGDPRLYAVDLSLTGAWGEGHNLDLTPPDLVQELVDAFVEGFPRTPLLGQIAGPQLVNRIREKRPCGFRADCLGHMAAGWCHMLDYYPQAIAQMADAWRDAPVAFESCWTMRHWYEAGTDVDYVIEQSLKWHISSFNNKQCPVPRAWERSVNYWLEHMGYRFALRQLQYPGAAKAGDVLDCELWLENRGVAPICRALPFRFRLKGENHACVIDTGEDIRRWMPGDTVLHLELPLPEDLPAGHYALEAGIGTGEPGSPVVKLAMTAPNDGTWWKIGKIAVEG